MFLTAIAGLIISLFQCTVLFLIGEILCFPIELRKFLGFNTIYEQPMEFQKITDWIINIGKTVKMIAIVKGIAAIIILLMTK